MICPIECTSARTVSLFQMMDAKALMAADELSEEHLSEWLANGDSLFRLLKVGAQMRGHI